MKGVGDALMDSFFPLLCSLLIGVVASNAALLPAQVYWHTVFPNTHMPIAISDLLSSDTVMDSSKLKLGQSWNNYNFAATKENLHYFRQTNLFFLEQDLHPGSKMNMQFEKINASAKFLSRSEAESIPFSSKNLPEIVSRFSVQPGSDKDEAMKQTLRECEYPALNGEKKMCATSLESMVDFSVASLGTRNVKAVSTTVHSKDETPRQEYTIVSSGVKNLAQDELVSCHPQTYAYAVFYCHLTKSTKGYKVKMAGKDGTVVDAVAACHADTSAWNPKHIAFELLNVKPGTVPVCHFFPQDNVVFSHNN